jgi:hypothetical protein
VVTLQLEKKPRHIGVGFVLERYGQRLTYKLQAVGLTITDAVGLLGMLEN